VTTGDHAIGAGQRDIPTDLLTRAVGAILITLTVLVALPLVIPVLVDRLGGNLAVTKTRFWIVWKWQWLYNLLGMVVVLTLIAVEGTLVTGWIHGGGAAALRLSAQWRTDLVGALLPWAIVNLLSGVFLLPVGWSWRRRRIAELVRSRKISDVIRQERIETARKRAADLTAAHRMGVRVDPRTGQILGSRSSVTTVPHPVGDGLQAFGMLNQTTVQTMADRFHDARLVRDWLDPTGQNVVLPRNSSSVRALIIAESGSGKTVLLNGLVLCALEYGWPVFVIDAKGDPADAESLAAVAETYHRSTSVAGRWNLFNGTSENVTSKLMRLMPAPDGANQHYLDEIRGVLQAVQDASPIRSVGELRQRLNQPGQFVRDQFDLEMVNHTIDRTGTTAGLRALQSLLIALRPLERWISNEGWSFDTPLADVTVVPLSPVDDAQARLGDLLILDLRHFLAARLERRDKKSVLVIVDEFAQLVTGTQDPGDTAGSLFETARSAGVGLVLSTQSPAGVSNDEVRRRRALTSGAALIVGRSKDPEDLVKYAGTAIRMEASGRAAGDQLGSGRAQHSFVIPPQDVREAADGAFWLVQAGAIAPFRALPHKPAHPQAPQPAAPQPATPQAATPQAATPPLATPQAPAAVEPSAEPAADVLAD
jgi:hypothetical protein